MKRMILMAGIALAGLAAGCNKVKQLADINVDIPYSSQVNILASTYDSLGFVLPAGGASLSLPPVPVVTNSQQYISEYKTSTDKILDVDLKSLALQIVSPPNHNFDFLDNVQVYISSNTLPEVLVASQDIVPKGSTTLNLNTQADVNLKSYFVQDTIYFRLETHINAIPPLGTQLNIASVFHLLANPLE